MKSRMSAIMMTAAVAAASAIFPLRADVSYYDPVGKSNAVCKAYTTYTDQAILNSGWYVVTGDITNDTTIVVDGDAHLILADGASLTADGGIIVDVNNNITNSLTIWEIGRAHV